MNGILLSIMYSWYYHVQDILQEVYSLDLAGPVARQYFMEVSEKVFSTQLPINTLYCFAQYAWKHLLKV